MAYYTNGCAYDLNIPIFKKFLSEMEDSRLGDYYRKVHKMIYFYKEDAGGINTKLLELATEELANRIWLHYSETYWKEEEENQEEMENA